MLSVSYAFIGVVPLKEAVGDILGKHVRSENLFWLLDVAESYDVAQLRVVCGAFVAKNISFIINNDRYLNLSLLALAELLKQARHSSPTSPTFGLY